MSCAMRYHVCSQPFISCTASLLLLIFHVICRLLLCLFNLSVLCIANNSYYRYSPTPRGVGCRVYSVFFSSLSVFSDTYICPRLDANLSIIISLCFLIKSTKAKNLFLMFVHILCWGGVGGCYILVTEQHGLHRQYRMSGRMKQLWLSTSASDQTPEADDISTLYLS